MQNSNRLISVAPMLDITHRHARYFYRLISRKVWLYSEMIVDQAIIHHSDQGYLLGFSPEEKPVALQLGGSSPDLLAKAAQIGASYGYDEINLNVGCPSSRVQSGSFGACLMQVPDQVGRCVEAMRRVVSVPVTIKTRIGIDQDTNLDRVSQLIDQCDQRGCRIFIIHARNAWLKGLSPKENRTIPPLNYGMVYALKQQFPKLTIILNGGIGTWEAAEVHLTQVDGVMLGRAVAKDPYRLAEVDHRFFGVIESPKTREAIADQYLAYVQKQQELGVPLSVLAQPLFGLYQGQRNAKEWRKRISHFILTEKW